MERIRFSLLTLALAATFSQSLGCRPGTVYVSFGQHVDFYHSYRGDSPTEDGFGTDIKVITQTLDYLENHPQVKLSWEFDSWQTLEQRLPEYAPELLARIKARVAEKDEVRFQSWNAGVVSAETPAEFAAGIRWQRQDLLQIFGKAENGVYPQEMMHTPSLIKAYGDLGIQWVSLFYSACPFTAFRNEVDLTGPELYNPLWLETPEGGSRMVLLPTYHHSDVADFLGMANWANHVRNTVPGDALIFISFDADAISWPIVLGLFLPALEKLDFVKFCTPGEYLATHEPVGTVVLRQDHADGAFDGYSSWAEKPINHDIWTAVEASRLGEERARHLMEFAGQESDDVEALLARNFRKRMETMKTTHFGLATPFLHPDRVEAAYEHAADIVSLSGQAVDLAETEAAPYLHALAGSPPALPFLGSSRPFYVYHPESCGGRTLVRVPLEFDSGETRTGGIRVFQVVGPEKSSPAGARAPGEVHEIPSGLLDVSLYPDQTVREAIVVFQSELSASSGAVYWISRSTSPLAVEPDYGLLPDKGEDVLANSLVRVEFDSQGWPTSLERGGLEFSGERLINPGITFGGEYVGPEQLTDPDVSGSIRERGFFRELGRRGEYAVPCGSETLSGWVEYRFRIYPQAPSLEIQAEVAYPGMEEGCLNRITEVYPLGFLPNLAAKKLKVWKRNYFGYVGSYDILEPEDSINSHVTASWVALSDEGHGLMLAYRADELAGLAFCPFKVKEGFFGNLEALMNPFGSHYGEQPDHDARRTGGLGLGEFMTVLLGEQFEPSAEAYPGTVSRFSLLVIPYPGDAPAAAERRLAQGYSYPPGVVAIPE